MEVRGSGSSEDIYMYMWIIVGYMWVITAAVGGAPTKLLLAVSTKRDGMFRFGANIYTQITIRLPCTLHTGGPDHQN
jgi:hypothetical protein